MGGESEFERSFDMALANPALARQIFSKKNAKEAAKLLDWGKIRDEITAPLMNDIKNGTLDLKDSVDSYMHRSITPPKWLIDEAIMDYFRKLGK